MKCIDKQTKDSGTLRMVFDCGESDFVKVHAKPMHKFGRVMWRLTASHCDSGGRLIGDRIHPLSFDVISQCEGEDEKGIEARFSDGLSIIVARVTNHLKEEGQAYDILEAVQ